VIVSPTLLCVGGARLPGKFDFMQHHDVLTACLWYWDLFAAFARLCPTLSIPGGISAGSDPPPLQFCSWVPVTCLRLRLTTVELSCRCRTDVVQ
jgi:hypothetical protein